jgi:hypothetical protein
MGKRVRERGLNYETRNLEIYYSDNCGYFNGYRYQFGSYFMHGMKSEE